MNQSPALDMYLTHDGTVLDLTGPSLNENMLLQVNDFVKSHPAIQSITLFTTNSKPEILARNLAVCINGFHTQTLNQCFSSPSAMRDAMRAFIIKDDAHSLATLLSLFVARFDIPLQDLFNPTDTDSKKPLVLALENKKLHCLLLLFRLDHFADVTNLYDALKAHKDTLVSDLLLQMNACPDQLFAITQLNNAIHPNTSFGQFVHDTKRLIGKNTQLIEKTIRDKKGEPLTQAGRFNSKKHPHPYYLSHHFSLVCYYRELASQVIKDLDLPPIDKATQLIELHTQAQVNCGPLLPLFFLGGSQHQNTLIDQLNQHDDLKSLALEFKKLSTHIYYDTTKPAYHSDMSTHLTGEFPAIMQGSTNDIILSLTETTTKICTLLRYNTANCDAKIHDMLNTLGPHLAHIVLQQADTLKKQTPLETAIENKHYRLAIELLIAYPKLWYANTKVFDTLCKNKKVLMETLLENYNTQNHLALLKTLLNPGKHLSLLSKLIHTSTGNTPKLEPTAVTHLKNTIAQLTQKNPPTPQKNVLTY